MQLQYYILLHHIQLTSLTSSVRARSELYLSSRVETSCDVYRAFACRRSLLYGRTLYDIQPISRRSTTVVVWTRYTRHWLLVTRLCIFTQTSCIVNSDATRDR
jgi:hypothetical protein